MKPSGLWQPSRGSRDTSVALGSVAGHLEPPPGRLQSPGARPPPHQVHLSTQPLPREVAGGPEPV